MPLNRAAYLERVPLLANLDAGSLARLAETTSLRQYRKGQIIYYRGDPGNAMYVLLDGQPRCVTAVAGEATQALAIYRENLLALLQLHADAALQIALSLSLRVRRTTDLLADMNMGLGASGLIDVSR